MKEKKQILFIINPNSGVRKKTIVPKVIKKHLDSNQYEYDIAFTKAAGHATELAREAVINDFDIIVAVGGDGSANEVAAGLIGTDKTFAILPCGSGNGFATYTGIGRNFIKAISTLNKGKVVRIDTCTMNGQPFINLCGFGFDGEIAYALENSPRRGFLPYFYHSITKAFNAGFQDYTITIDDGVPFQRTTFVLEIGNAQMFGYNFTIVPQASLTDGYIDLLLVKKAHQLQILPLVPRLLLNNLDKGGRLVETYRAKKIQIDFDAPIYMHYDGEGFIQKESRVMVEVVPKSLNVLLPLNSKVQ